ncbi:MAG: protein-export chaperone SecB [Magnetococcales bacterium]|nr:protein-export chaperone SecB [Magnetococcales bacterium]MBF0150545.1 protein-export chaperone SecB [Magnetococcales bacterium]MBF0174836.1 protein-export chaperone SecB [Magnetococcales bacterium]MBF0631762.1 protein-export chaperone SecB [Magnetococcales bacterium]
MTEQQPVTPPSNQPVFNVERLYIKDLSFENPNAPEVYSRRNDPTVEFNLGTGVAQKGEDHYEVTLQINARVKDGEDVLFLVDVTYAGLFRIRNLPQEHLSPTLGIECPHIIFPYARRIISDLVMEGGFKPMVLDPINFAALYQQAKAREAKK